ncbi:MAG: LysR substrate-binding domain-containing protein [Bacteroidaceae bacterium]|nr:LysR substrate-binding domain-containing protein [Bacteroidaceae bacterium]
MELRQIKYFVAVAKTLNFSDAAKELFITQGTLSQQIRQLEDEIGSKLFDRTSHSVSLTEAGQEMLPLARHALETSAECFQRISDLRKGLTGTLNIGLTTSFMGIMSKAIQRFQKDYPSVKLNIFYTTASELVQMLQEHELDFFIAFKSAVMFEELDTIPLMDTELSAVMNANHPLATRKTLTLNELKHHRIVLPSSGLQARKAFDRFVDADTSSLNVCIEINNPNAIIRLVHSTRLIAIMSSLATYIDPDLVAVPIEEMRRKMTACVHVLKDKYLKKSAAEFIKAIKESV